MSYSIIGKTESYNVNRLEEYDISKGIAILLVVLGHLLGQSFDVGEELQIIITFCHMPVFFFISGFFLFFSLSRHPGKTVLLGKLRKLAVPYVSWSFISFSANIILNNKFNISAIKNEFVEIFINARSVWFLAILFISTFICIVLLTLSDYVGINKYLLLVIGYLSISIIFPDTYFAMFKFKWLFPFFIMGMWYAEYKNKLSVIHKVSACCLVFPYICILAYNPTYYNTYILFEYSDFISIVWGIAYYLLSLLGIGFVFVISFLSRKTKIGNIFMTMGKYSLEIYVMHMLFVKFLLIIPIGLYGNESIFTYIYILLYTFIIIGLIIFLSKNVFDRFKIYRIIIGKVTNK